MEYIFTEEQLSTIVNRKSNFDKIMDHYISLFPANLVDKGEELKDHIKKYINNTGYNVKFLNSCSAGFAGVRTKDQVIICKPGGSLGDFVYTLFHEIRHEQQVRDIKMSNPFSDYDLEDFENLFAQYWEMELDADQFAKNMVAILVIKTKLPIEFAKNALRLSGYIERYPLMSMQIGAQIKHIIQTIKSLKKQGIEFNDIQDLPMVKQHIDKLEDLF